MAGLLLGAGDAASELSLSTSRLNYSQERHNGKVDFARQRDRLKIVSQSLPS